MGGKRGSVALTKVQKFISKTLSYDTFHLFNNKQQTVKGAGFEYIYMSKVKRWLHHVTTENIQTQINNSLNDSDPFKK